MRLMRREYTKLAFVESLDEDGSSEYSDELARTQNSSDSTIIQDGGQIAMSMNTKRLKDVTVKHILENFQKLGNPGLRSTYSRRAALSDQDFEDDDESMRSLSYRYSDPEDANWEVPVEQVKHLINNCGGDLKKFESFYLLRRSNYETQDSTKRTISCSDFTDAVESYMNDANTDPYALVLYLFKLKFGDQE